MLTKFETWESDDIRNSVLYEKNFGPIDNWQSGSFRFALTEGICKFVGEPLWPKAFVVGYRRTMSLFNYTLAFALQERQSTDSLN
jgi:hypothetical protein